MTGMLRCIICAGNSAHYRCRQCRSMYCSLNCFKEHRDGSGVGSCSYEQQQLKEPKDGGGEDVVAKKPKLDSSRDGYITVCTEPTTGNSSTMEEQKELDCSAGARRSDDYSVYGRRDEDGSLVVLGEAHLAALARDAKLRNQLRSAELQRLLRIVNISRSRVDALEAALANVPEFKGFCENVLEVLGRVDVNFNS
ncbi:HIT zinc finger, putative [Trypanosoma equiperdum]|uniref:HIT-type domain-containing protein n=2 Tax=Trypanozoon TaxID=39700 RepID=Q386M1_TRYB2|nr:hypothetical protein, conserved [Trypanosoma brucei brucei TREU927]EAN79260.1 hypothetical protein, conserved [Trypanosoma brucei brucei TREU927]SCU72279.1 HIT zinc finger, putative [Trypanosoma equiperdum]